MGDTSGVYLHLFHGRNAVEEEMEDWGFDGPNIGPLDYVHGTYMTDLKIAMTDEVCAKFFPEEWERVEAFRAAHLGQVTIGYALDYRIETVDGMIVHDGKYYGDWSVSYHA